MRIDRRGFLRLASGAFALALGVPAATRAAPGARAVHRATRNTLHGALGVAVARARARPAATKSYPEAERIALPPADGEPLLSLAACVRGGPPPRGFAEAPLALAELGRLLYLANGVTGRRGGRLLRAAPSAGALYAGEVYVVAKRVTELPPGVYFYSVPDHALLRIAAGPLADEVARSVERPGALAGAAAFVLLTNVFGRYMGRYADRGYRYALIDSGHIGENLRLAALTAGLGEEGALRFHDDRLNVLLRVDGREEALCALHAVGPPGEPGVATAPAVRLLVEKSSGGGERGLGETERYHEATKLVEGNRASAPAADAPAAAEGRAPGVVRELPRGLAPPMRVDEAIRARRSADGFESEAIALESLAFVLEMACGHAWLRRAPGVELYVAAHRVADLEPGLYRYEAGSHRLAMLRSGELAGPMVRACLQQEMAGSAAVGLLMVAHIAREAARTGERSYRDLLVESGAIGQRVYLAAESVGLAARNLAAFLDDWLNGLLELDGEERAVVHLTMLGKEVRHPA